MTTCLEGEACPSGLACDEEVGVCREERPPQEPEPPEGTCARPFALALGLPLSLDLRDAEANLVSGTCPGAGGNGPELAFSVTSPLDGRVRLTAVQDGAFDVQMYTRRTCDDALTEIACVDTSLDFFPEEMEVPVLAHEPLVVIVDGFAGADAGPFTITAQLVVPAGAACTVDGVPDPARLCDFGTSCVSGLCAHDDIGDRCDTAIRLEGTSGSQAGDTRGRLDDDQADGTCNATVDFPDGFVMDGRDAVYVIAMEPGQTVTLHLVTAFGDLGLAVQGSCPSPADGGCLAQADLFGRSSAEDLTYTHAGPANDVFVVVDGYEPTEFGAYTLTWSLE